jgi:hypothetical protein
MLAVIAGDGTCGENSTQPTARVSQVVFGVPDTGTHHLHVPGFGPLLGRVGFDHGTLASPTGSVN